jgi:putative endonuclease
MAAKQTFDHLALGRWGEDRVCEWYKAHGYTILARNWRCRDGELDVVVLRDGVLAACEVKTRSSNRFGSPLEAINPRRWARMRAATGAFVRLEQPRGVRRIRLDVAAVVGREVTVVEGAS